MLILLALSHARGELFAADNARRYKSYDRAPANPPVFDDDLNLAYRALEDFANGGKLAAIPLRALQLMSSQLGRLVPHTPAFFTGEDGPLLSTSDVKRQARYGLALSPVQCRSDCEGCSEYTARLCSGALPDAELVWSQLLRRGDTYIPETGVPINFLMVTFVNWFHDDTFRTAPHTNGGKLWRAKDGLSLAQVYGDSYERERVLRTFANGKMRTSTAENGEILPPRLEDVLLDDPSFEMWRASPGVRALANISDMYALGDPRFNMHPGHLLWGTIALRLHNRFCDIVAASRPSYSDQQLFTTARHLLTHIVLKVRTEDFVSDAIAPFRDRARIAYDPEHMRLLSEFRSDFTPIWYEFSSLYRWHALIPDAFQLQEDGADRGGAATQSDAGVSGATSSLPVSSTMFNPKAFDLPSQGIGKLLRSLKETRMGRYGPRNIPNFLHHITLRSIRDARRQRLRSFNDYREFFGLSRHTSFHDFGMSPEDTISMQELYGSPDNVEYFVGIMCEVGQASGGGGRILGNILGDTQLAILSLMAVQDLVSLDHVRLPELWSEELLSAEGKAFVNNFSWGELLSEALDGGSSEVRCPFFTDDFACTPKARQEHVDHRKLRLANIVDFAGLDYFANWFWDDTGYYLTFAFCATLSAMVAVIILYVITGGVCQRIFEQGKGST
ncbi:MAG: hypothetical protein SGPRY_014633, partial [Prymnesium sp.]